MSKSFGAAECSDASRGSVMEEASGQADANFFVLFSSHPQAMWVYDPATLAILAVNEAALHYYGYSREEFLSRTVEEFHPEGEFALLRDRMESGDGPIACRHIKKDGTCVGAGLFPRPMNFGGCRSILVRIAGATPDIRSEILYTALVDSLPVSVLAIDPGMNVTTVNCQRRNKTAAFPPVL